MLFTGSAQTSGRVRIDAATAISSYQSGFAYTSAGKLCTSAGGSPNNFLKGIGTNAGRVCTTTSTAGTDTFIEGVRVSASGQLVIANAANANVTSGNPVTATGALATTTS